MTQIPSMPVSAVQALASNLSVLEQARLPPTATEMLERIVKQQTEAEAIIHAALPGWLSHGDGAWREISRARRLLDEVIGPGSAMQQLAEAARVTTARYATLFGPTSELVNRLVPALRHAPAFQELQETIRYSVDAVCPAAERFRSVAELINRQVLGDSPRRVSSCRDLRLRAQNASSAEVREKAHDDPLSRGAVLDPSDMPHAPTRKGAWRFLSLGTGFGPSRPHRVVRRFGIRVVPGAFTIAGDR